MPFIGNQPALSYTSFAKQDFTTSATTSYTLDHPVTNENEIALFINFVRQEPTTAYSASGTSLTLTSATSASDDMYCVFLGKAVQTVNPPNSSVGSSQVSADLITGQTALGATPADTDELLISDAGTLKRVDYSYLKSANTPAFEANLGSNQTPSNDVNTLVVFDTERYDTDSAYDTSTGKFQPQTAGKYFVYGSIAGQSTVNNGNLYKTATMIYFNGSETRTQDIIGENAQDIVFGRLSVPTSGVFTFNGSSDYVQLYANIQTRTGGDVSIQSNSIRTFFGAYKIIGA